jgi:hypothetical protein
MSDLYSFIDGLGCVPAGDLSIWLRDDDGTSFPNNGPFPSNGTFDRVPHRASNDSLSGSGTFGAESAAAELAGMATSVSHVATPDVTPIPHVDPSAVLAEAQNAGGIFAASARLASLATRRPVCLNVAPTTRIYTVEELLASWASQTRCVVAEIEASPVEMQAVCAREFVAAVYDFVNNHVAPLCGVYGLNDELEAAASAPPAVSYITEEEVLEQGEFSALATAASVATPIETAPSPMPSRKRSAEEANEPCVADVLAAEYCVGVVSGFTECHIAESRLAKLFSAEQVAPAPAEELIVPVIEPALYIYSGFAACLGSPLPSPIDEDLHTGDDSSDDIPLVYKMEPKRVRRDTETVTVTEAHLPAQPELAAAPAPTITMTEPRTLTPVRTTAAIRPPIDVDATPGSLVHSARPVASSSAGAFRPTVRRRRAVLGMNLTMQPAPHQFEPEAVRTTARFVIALPSGLSNAPSSLVSLASHCSQRTAMITINLDHSESSVLSWPVICDFVEAVARRSRHLRVTLRCSRLPRVTRRLNGISRISLVRTPGSTTFGSITELVNTSSLLDVSVDGHISTSATNAHDASHLGLSYRAEPASRHAEPPAWDADRCAEHPLRRLESFAVRHSVPEGLDVDEFRLHYPAGMKTFMALDPLVRHNVRLIVPDCTEASFVDDVVDHIVTMPTSKCPPVRFTSPHTSNAVARAITIRIGLKTPQRWAEYLRRMEMPSGDSDSTFVRLSLPGADMYSFGTLMYAANEKAFPEPSHL